MEGTSLAYWDTTGSTARICPKLAAVCACSLGKSASTAGTLVRGDALGCESAFGYQRQNEGEEYIFVPCLHTIYNSHRFPKGRIDLHIWSDQRNSPQ
jgi:hypothetical protein